MRDQDMDDTTWHAVGDAASVACVVAKLRHPRVLWANPRWFLERGTDLADAAARAEAQAWLLDRFAYVVAGDVDQAHLLPGERKLAYADRYGGEGIGRHGGSGRVVTHGAYQVKGVGPTPLVPNGTDFMHSHGWLFLTEAVRDAIYAEVLWHEAPLRALPVIALIDTGFPPFEGADGQVIHERRVLLVRAAPLRPAHCERALFFQPDAADHLADARRVRQFVRFFGEVDATGARRFSPSRYAQNIAAQLAFCAIHRFSIGAYSSSNVGIDGEFLDFGAFSALPSWYGVTSVVGSPGFGRELPAAAENLGSLAFYLHKYDASSAADAGPEAVDILYARFKQQWQHQLLSMLEVDRASYALPQVDNFVRRFLAYFAALQTRRGDLELYPECDHRIDDALFAFDRTDSLPALVKPVTEALGAMYAALKWPPQRVQRSIGNARAALEPRANLWRPWLHRHIAALVERAQGASLDLAPVIAEAIRENVSLGRRLWPDIAGDLVLCGQASWHYCHVLYLRCPVSRKKYLQLSGTRVGRVVHCFGARIGAEAWDAGASEPASYVLVDVDADYLGGVCGVTVHGTPVSIPGLDRFSDGLPRET